MHNVLTNEIIEKIRKIFILEESYHIGDLRCFINYKGEKEESQYPVVQVPHLNEETLDYLVGDFSRDNGNEMEKFLKYIINDIDDKVEIHFLLFFESWSQSMNVFYKCLNKLETTNKKKLRNLYDSSNICYLKDSEISISLEDYGTNYLEHSETICNYMEGKETDEEIKSIIFNLSFENIEKIYDQMGNNLFDGNVRIGVDNTKSRELKLAFRKSILSGVYHSLFHELSETKKGDKFYVGVDAYIRNKVYLDFSAGEMEDYKKYYFRHNGITFFSDIKYFGEFKFSSSSLSLSPKRFNVINGAQTISHMFSEFYSLKNEIISEIRKEVDEEQAECGKYIKLVESAFKEVQSWIKVKAIFVFGSPSDMLSITKGLNSQIPVNPEDISYDRKDLDSINDKLKSECIIVSRPGEKQGFIYTSYTVLEFIKAFYNFNQKPGEARNYNKKKVHEDIHHIKKETIDNPEFIRYLKIWKRADKWWKSVDKKNFDEVQGNEYLELCNKHEINDSQLKSYEIFSKNGLYYFKSYLGFLAKDKNYDFSESSFLKEYQELSKIVIDSIIVDDHYKTGIESNTLKTDDFYVRIISIKNKKDNLNTKVFGLDNIPDLNSFFKDRLESNNKQNFERKSTNHAMISTYLFEHDFESPSEFRTITLNKDGRPTEAFPLSSKTFSEIYIDSKTANAAYKKYEESELSEQMARIFHLFVINEIEESVEIEYIEKFTLSDLKSEAKEVYNRTVEAFKKGDSSIFPKESENFGLHVRPKARDKDDVFEFTDGSLETKRTFWISKESLKVQIDRQKAQIDR